MTELVRAAGGVADPLSTRTLGELGLVLGATSRGRHPRVTVAALDDEPGYRARLARDVGAATAGADVEVVAANEALRRGVAEVLRRDQRRPGSIGTGTRVLAVASGKGGVGKSTVTANLAVALAGSGLRVGVIDADVWGYSQTAVLGVRRAPVAVPGMMFPVDAHGVRLMSIGFFVSEEQPVAWRGPMLHKALEQFLDDVCWGPLDLLLVDLPPGTGDASLSLLDLLPGAAVVVVTTPQAVAASVAARAGRMATAARTPLAGVIENMSGGTFGSGGGAAVAAELGVPLLATVPLDPVVCASGEDGVPVVLSAPASAAARQLTDAAGRLAAFRRPLSGRSLPLFVAT